MKARAIIAKGPSSEGTANFRMSDVEVVLPLNDHELLVEVVASGICHTDLVFAEYPESELIGYPRVLGHEGIGWVHSVGSAVTIAKPGDAVSLSFTSCGSCSTCTAKHPAYCSSFPALNCATIRPPAFKIQSSPSIATETTCTTVHGHFFGQSSFASITRVEERAVVNVNEWVRNEKDMVDLAPMGCAFQTGAGTVEHLGRAREGDTVVVMGLGGVGMAAVMAAKILKCKRIIAVDRIPSRLNLSIELGATETINTTETDLVTEVKRLTDGAGSTITVDTTGVPALLQQALLFTGLMGRFILVGVPPPGSALELDIVNTMQSGLSVIGSIEGDAVPEEYIPKMIKWFREGIFPVDKLIKTYPAADFQRAINDMHTGATIKPVLLWK